MFLFRMVSSHKSTHSSENWHILSPYLYLGFIQNRRQTRGGTKTIHECGSALFTLLQPPVSRGTDIQNHVFVCREKCDSNLGKTLCAPENCAREVSTEFSNDKRARLSRIVAICWLNLKSSGFAV